MIIIIQGMLAFPMREISKGQLTRANLLQVSTWGLESMQFFSKTWFTFSRYLKNTFACGSHLSGVDADLLGYQLVFAIGLIYIIGIAVLKLSILLLYLRIFGINRRFKIACWCLAAFILCYTIVGVFLSIFQFSPVRGSWDVTIDAVENVDTRTLTTTLAALNVVSDFLTLVLPMVLVLRLKIPTKQKVQLTLVFLLGGW